MAFLEGCEQADKLFKAAWRKATKLECENGLLLKGRILRMLAYLKHAQGNNIMAEGYTSRPKERLFNAAP